jgi:hypothetical protein
VAAAGDVVIGFSDDIGAQLAERERGQLWSSAM